MKKVCFLLFLLIILSLIPFGKASPDDWVSPTGFEDPDNVWSNESAIYDESTGTYAFSSCPAMVWSSFVHVTIDEITSDKLRYYLGGAGSQMVDLVDIDIYSGDAWVHVYEGGDIFGVWYTKEFEECQVTKARIRLHSNFFFPNNVRVYEFDFWEVSIPIFPKRKNNFSIS